MMDHFGHRSFYRFYPAVDTFHTDYHSNLKNYLQIHLGVYPDLYTTPATNLPLLSHNTPSALPKILGDRYLLPILS
jgi:hypothetical protein